MILDKVLILKGLGGLTVLGGSAAAVCFVVFNNDSPESLIEKAGLKCTFNGDSCEITSLESGKKINVKNNTTKEEGKTFTISSPSTVKIKVQKNVTEGGYNQNLKLTIEGGDIDLTGGTASGSNSITKLEQFETYEIVKEEGKYYLSWKSTAIDEKSKALGLPTEDSTCKLPTSNNSSTTCTLDTEKLKKIKFDGKQENQDITVTGTVTLTITKVDSTDSIFGKGGYKFAFNSTEDLSIPKSTGSDSISIKKGSNTEFKIKETAADGGAKTLSLEKAWTVTTLAQKVGLTNCTTTTGSTKECTFSDNATLNLFISSNDTKENVTITGSNKKIKYEEDAANHNQGFKFYIDESGEEITLSGNDSKKIEKKSNSNTPTYEIKEIDGQWYLAKKTNSSS